MRAFFATAVFCLTSVAIDIPYLTGPLVDEAKLLSTSDEHLITQTLEKINASQKAQVVVLIAGSLQGLEIESYSIAVAEKWKLGTKKVDNGLLFVIAPKERKMRLEVGYGLEGEIPDAIAKRILDEAVGPYFRKGQFAQGINQGLETIASRLQVEGYPAQQHQLKDKPVRFRLGELILLGIIVFFILFLNWTGGYYRSGFGGHGRRYGSSGWGGGGSWGGGSGGGFSGGGGSFGGGGSSSSW